MPRNQYWPCALIAGDLPSLTGRGSIVAVILMTLGFEVYLLGNGYLPIDALMLTSVSVFIGRGAFAPLTTLNQYFRGLRNAVDPAAD